MSRAPRIAIVVSILTLVVSILGFIAVLVLNTFVLDEYDAYGEVTIPGSTSLHLPAGEMTVSFHTVTTGTPTSGFPIPNLSFGITGPAGLPQPTVTESIGGRPRSTVMCECGSGRFRFLKRGPMTSSPTDPSPGTSTPTAGVRARRLSWLDAVAVRRSLRLRPVRAVRRVDLVGACRARRRDRSNRTSTVTTDPADLECRSPRPAGQLYADRPGRAVGADQAAGRAAGVRAR